MLWTYIVMGAITPRALAATHTRPWILAARLQIRRLIFVTNSHTQTRERTRAELFYFPPEDFYYSPVCLLRLEQEGGCLSESDCVGSILVLHTKVLSAFNTWRVPKRRSIFDARRREQSVHRWARLRGSFLLVRGGGAALAKWSKLGGGGGGAPQLANSGKFSLRHKYGYLYRVGEYNFF